MNITDFVSVPYKKGMGRLDIPATKLQFSEEGMKSWNWLLKYFSNYYEAEDWTILKRTEKDNIRIGRASFQLPAWGVFKYKARIEFIIFTAQRCIRVIMGTNKVENVSGRKAYQEFRKACKKFHVNLDDYATEYGEIKKEEIERAIIENRTDDIGPKFTYEHVQHIDLNSSYMSGIAHFNEELRPVIEYIYSKRDHSGSETDRLYKGILNSSFGFFQSEYCVIDGNKYALADLSADAIRYNNFVIRRIVSELTKLGCKILLINTDGIWYQGDRYNITIPGWCSYGDGLGQYKYDHKNCTLRIASRGAYEYIEDGKYHPVLRGSTRYERFVPRENWKWGDIFRKDNRKVFAFDLNTNYNEKDASTWNVTASEAYV